MSKQLLKPIIFSTSSLGNPLQKIDSATQALDVDVFRAQLVDVLAIATANTSLTTPGAIGGVTPVDGGLYLLPAQSVAAENLFYNYDLANDELVVNDWLSQQMTANNIGLVYALPTGGTLSTHYYKLTTLSPVIGTDSITWEDLTDDINVVASGLTQSAVVAAATTIAAGDVVAVNSSNELILARAGVGDTGLFKAVGIAVGGGTTGQTVSYCSRGKVTGAFAFAGGDVAKNLWVDPTTAGDYTLTAPTTTGQYQFLLGRVIATNTIYVLADDQTYAIV